MIEEENSIQMIDESEAIKMEDSQVDEIPIPEFEEIESNQLANLPDVNTSLIPPFIANKNHTIKCNDEEYVFEEGQTYTDIPFKWQTTLQSEKVIK